VDKAMGQVVHVPLLYGENRVWASRLTCIFKSAQTTSRGKLDIHGMYTCKIYFAGFACGISDLELGFKLNLLKIYLFDLWW
jgi:hypothetical protein